MAWSQEERYFIFICSLFFVLLIVACLQFSCPGSGLIKSFLRDVDWSELDVLVVDTPPGTTDEHLSIVQMLKEAGIDGAVVITTPQEVALSDVRKELDFCRKVNLPVLGVVENMRGFVCPGCHVRLILIYFFVLPCFLFFITCIFSFLPCLLIFYCSHFLVFVLFPHLF